MNIILLSGGSGKRLWPLSNGIRSKQFLRIFKKKDGTYESMVQRMYHGILKADPQATITIATSREQHAPLTNQLGEQIDISYEPCRRDTFPAIALACAYLHDKRNIAKDAPVIVCPVDPFVDDTYFEALTHLDKLIQSDQANLTCLGIEPTYPSEKYGYLIPKDRSPVSPVLTFKEKPDLETAQKYIAEGALWNGGIFAFRLGWLLKKASDMIGFSDYTTLYDRYSEIDPISFDYAVGEKEAHIQVLRFNGIWKDLGTWNTLTEAMPEQAIGRVTMNNTCKNTHVVSDLDLPILCMGLTDLVVAASPDGILVSDKSESSYIKPYVDQMTDEVRYAEKSWGSFCVIDIGDESLTIKVTLNPGHKMHYHAHAHRDETWTVIAGSGIAMVDGVRTELTPGSFVRMCAGQKHTVFAKTELQLIEVQTGASISKEDKTVFEMPTELPT